MGLSLWIVLTVVSGCVGLRSIVVSGANKGQGLALCRRILTEQKDTFVFLGSRDASRGKAAVQTLHESGCGAARVEWIPLDVTDAESVHQAVNLVQNRLGGEALYAVVSNAGILWGYTLEEQFAVNTVGACRVMDGFLRLLHPQEGRLVVVSSGLAPLMHGYADKKRQTTLQSPTLTLDDITEMMNDCLQDESAEGLASAGFPGGPFAEPVPDFHKYGIAKSLADAYMASLARQNKHLRIFSCDPGLVYTDLILQMPKYEGQAREETGAKTPGEGVTAAMKLLFTEEGKSGCFHAMDKAQTQLLTSEIYAKPTE